MYATLSSFLIKFFKKNQVFKYGFNLSPMYRRTTGKIHYVSEDLKTITIKISKNYKNMNYARSIFGGSLFSATDPIFMVQLVNLLGDDYIVWDKKSTIHFKKPANDTVYSHFAFNDDEITDIKSKIKQENKIDIVKDINLSNKDGSIVFAEISKTLYIADKKYYKNRLQQRA